MKYSYDPPKPGTQPTRRHDAYRSTIERNPRKPLIQIPQTISELTGPVYGHNPIGETDNDLTRHFAEEPQGQRIYVSGRVLDEDGRPVRKALVEIWQANASGRYHHPIDNHPAPLDSNFIGGGRTTSDDNGEYKFVTIRPGSYPWKNHHNAWRPAHIHFSMFGAGLLTRLITQMYFPDDPLFPFDPIMQSIPDENARKRLISRFDLDTTEPEWALSFKFDIVLRGRNATPFES